MSLLAPPPPPPPPPPLLLPSRIWDTLYSGSMPCRYKQSHPSWKGKGAEAGAGACLAVAVPAALQCLWQNCCNCCRELRARAPPFSGLAAEAAESCTHGRQADVGGWFGNARGRGAEGVAGACVVEVLQG